jgi:hypothetical protein
MKRALLILLLLPIVIGCGPKTKPVLIKIDASIYEAVKALHETTAALGRAGLITPAAELDIQQAILPVAVLGEQTTRVIAAWKSGPTPPELQKLVTELGLLVRKIVDVLPQNPQGKAILLERIAVVQQAVLTVIVVLGGVA